MFERIADLLRTRTARHTFTLFFGSLASRGIALALLVGLMHVLSREDYDRFGLFMTIMWTVYDLTELGMNNSLVRHAAEHVAAGRLDRAAGFLRWVAGAKALLWAAALVAGFLAARPLAAGLLGDPGHGPLVLLAFAGGVGLGVIVLFNGIFYCFKQFYKDVILSLLQNLSKLAAVAAVILLLGASLQGVAVAYVGAAWAAGLAGLLLVPRAILRRGAAAPGDLASIARFGGWFALIALASSAEARLGVYLLKILPGAGEHAVADFFGAQNLSMAFVFLVTAYFNVMFSKVSSLSDWSEVVRVQRKSALPLAALAGLLALAIAGAGVFVPWIFPAKYAAAVPAVRWLFLSVIFSVAGLPFLMAIVHAKRAGALLAGHLAALPALAVLCWLWVPRHGAAGLAAAQAAATGLNQAVIVLYALFAMPSRARERLPGR
jgi:O-antigen/teichoic acid export membrane protein